MTTSSSQPTIATLVEAQNHTPQSSETTGIKAPFVPPKLTFVAPKLTKQGTVENLTASMFGTMSPI